MEVTAMMAFQTFHTITYHQSTNIEAVGAETNSPSVTFEEEASATITDSPDEAPM